MPDYAVVKKAKPEIMAISALFGVTGLGLILWSLRGGGYGLPLRPDEDMRNLRAPELDAPGPIVVTVGEPTFITMPTVEYIGAGRDTYTHFQIQQKFDGEWVTVYGSGVAGVHVGPADVWTPFLLVSPNEDQPPDCGNTPASTLCAFPWGTGHPPFPPGFGICGAEPVLGYGRAVLEIFTASMPQDGDGFSSPTCGNAAAPVPRVPLVKGRRVYEKKIRFE